MIPKLSLLSVDPRQTIKQNVTEALGAAILSGRIKPGERLNESKLSRELGVSRAPIREALLCLAEQGLVANSPRRGAFVVDLDEDEVRKVNSVRLILEAEALRLARANLTPQSLTKLKGLLARLERNRESSAAVQIRCDQDFHRALWKLAGNEYLEHTLNSLVAPVFAQAVLRHATAREVALLSHEPIMEFIRGRLAGSAEEVMAEHLRNYWPAPDQYSSFAARPEPVKSGTA